jgi:hypothetical protein
VRGVPPMWVLRVVAGGGVFLLLMQLVRLLRE